MSRKNQTELFRQFENKGKYKSTSFIFSIISVFFLVIDIALCVINFPYVKQVFSISIILSLISIVVYVIFEQKLENVQKYILYLEDRSILSIRNIKRCLNEKERIRISREIERYSSLNKEYKLINRISLDTLLKLRESLEMNKGV